MIEYFLKLHLLFDCMLDRTHEPPTHQWWNYPVNTSVVGLEEIGDWITSVSVQRSVFASPDSLLCMF